MNDVTVFIMAAGDATRYNKRLKQLLQLPDGNMIIERLIKQIKYRGHDPVVVTRNEKIAAVHSKTFVPDKKDTLCDSIFSTWPLWTRINIFILGDVVFTEHGINCAMHIYDSTKVIGNDVEMYAMQFNEANEEMVILSLLTAAAYRFGKLRYFYKAYAGLPIEGPEIEEDHLIWLRDETNDIDSLAEYRNMIARWNVSANRPSY